MTRGMAQHGCCQHLLGPAQSWRAQAGYSKVSDLQAWCVPGAEAVILKSSCVPTTETHYNTTHLHQVSVHISAHYTRVWTETCLRGWSPGLVRL